eukprot:scaffold47414_cov29-Tisochrysis_lutea.AAC.5
MPRHHVARIGDTEGKHHRWLRRAWQCIRNVVLLRLSCVDGSEMLSWSAAVAVRRKSRRNAIVQLCRPAAQDEPFPEFTT